MKKIVLALLFFSFLSLDLSASDLKAPMDLYSTTLLPQGVRNLRFRGMVVNGQDKFNEGGVVTPLSDPFYKHISWDDLVDPKSDSENKNLLAGYLASKKINLNDQVGQTTGDLSVQAKPIVPIFAIGWKEKLTLAIAVPIIRYRFSVQTGFLSGDNLKKVYDELEKDQKISELSELSEKMVNPIETKLKDFNYQPLKDEEGTLLGDISFTGKYQLIKSDRSNLTIQETVTMPTGKAKDENRLVSIGSDKVWSLATALIADYGPLSWLNMSFAAGYSYKIPDTYEKRVPYRQDSKVTPDKDESVSRRLGDEFFSQLGARLIPRDGITLSGGYTFQYKAADRYRGGKYDSARYDWMSSGSIQRLESLTLGLRLDTIQLFRSGKFVAPMEVALNHSIPLRGKNATHDPLTTLDASLFF